MKKWRLAAALVVAACGGGEGGGGAGRLAAPTVTDSAGVRIVENQVPPAGIPVYARVDAAPTLAIGSAEGEADDQFYQVRDARTLSTALTVVANGGTSQLRYYDADGRLLASTGAAGDGPGQFRNLTRMGLLDGDTVWVWDTRARRLSVFDAEGRLVRDRRAPGSGSVVGRLGDGSFVLVPGWSSDIHDRDPKAGVRRDVGRWLRWWPDRGDTVVLGTFPHDEVVVAEVPGGGHFFGTPPFGRSTSHAVAPDGFHVGDQETFEVRSHDADGSLRQIVRLNGVGLALTPEVVAAARAESRDPANPTPAWAERLWDHLPSTRPAYSRLLVDASGYLWVAEHVAVAAPPRNWLVFSPAGALLGLVEVPAGLRVTEIGVDHVLGVSHDDMGVERIHRYGLRRPRR